MFQACSGRYRSRWDGFAQMNRHLDDRQLARCLRKKCRRSRSFPSLTFSFTLMLARYVSTPRSTVSTAATGCGASRIGLAARGAYASLPETAAGPSGASRCEIPGATEARWATAPALHARGIGPNDQFPDAERGQRVSGRFERPSISSGRAIPLLTEGASIKRILVRFSINPCDGDDQLHLPSSRTRLAL